MTRIAIDRDNAPRVEILRDRGQPLKRPRFGYVVDIHPTIGGKVFFADMPMTTMKGDSGEPGFRVVKTKHDRRDFGVWYSSEGIRFTKPPKDLIAQLSDEEKVALDLVEQGGNGKLFTELVPSEERRNFVKTVAAQVKSLRAR